jgi:uncharacterized protein
MVFRSLKHSMFLTILTDAEDVAHSEVEGRYYCFGKVEDGIMTVRFTYRKRKVRIIGAGYWRKGRDINNAERP